MADFLYNGVELSDINDVWTDKKTYLYAWLTLIRRSSADYFYNLVLSQTAPVYDGSNSALSANNCVRYTHDANGTQWVYANTLEYVEYNMSAITFYGDKQNEPIWTSHDIINTADNSVYLAASEPVPVGGEPLDPTSMLMGWLVGRQIAGMRKEKHHE